MVSVTVTVPEVGLPPRLVTDSVKLFPEDPFINVPLKLLAIANAGVVVVLTVTVLLIAATLPPPLTVAAFATVAGALATLTGIVIDGN